MMVKKNLFPWSHLVILFFAVFIALFFVDQLTKRQHAKINKKVLETTLLSYASLMQEDFINYLKDDDKSALQKYCVTRGSAISGRVSIISDQGFVLGDSLEVPAQMGNIAALPEIRSALAGKGSFSERHSPLLQGEVLYYALPILYPGNSGKLLAIIRVGVPLNLFVNPSGSASDSNSLALLAIIAFLVCLLPLKTYLETQRSLTIMRDTMESVAAGNFHHKLEISRFPFFHSLIAAVNTMSDEWGKRLEDMKQQRNELEAVFSSMSEGLLVFDQQERFITVNGAAARLFNIDPESIPGKSVLEIVRNLELKMFVKKTLAANLPLEGEITLHGPQGERHFLLHGTPLNNAQNRTTGGLIVINDVTGLRQLERVRRDFVANVSHELKTPITSIKGFVETLLDGAIDDKETAHKFLNIISRQTEKLSAIITDLLSLSRIEQSTDQESLEFADHNLLETIQSAVQSCTIKAHQKQSDISVDCNMDIIVRCNRPLFEQALTNLLDNAIKYSPEQSKVAVQASTAEDSVLISVTDNGPGISGEHLPRLFERFFRIDKSRSNKVEGTGLGLAIVKYIVQAHGGDIAVESTFGKGTAFTIKLPI